jgi:two-component system phosphate regulon sensor histidine kinase PhoR
MILIVDDKKENLLSLQSILVLHGFPVHSAESGEEALRKTLKNNYALIILDVQMPGMDGFEVAEMLAGYTRTFDVPIIFLSAASTDKKFITKGYSSGAVDYITKPIDPDIFLLKVKTLYKLYEQNGNSARSRKSSKQKSNTAKLRSRNLLKRPGNLYPFLNLFHRLHLLLVQIIPLNFQISSGEIIPGRQVIIRIHIPMIRILRQ